MSDNTIKPVTLVVTYLFSAAVLAILWWVAYSGDTVRIFIASLGGSFAGALGATLDHNALSVKAAALEKMKGAQKAYLVLRACMGTSLGMAAAFLAQGALAPKPLAGATLWIVAFAAAYLFDMSRLSPAK